MLPGDQDDTERLSDDPSGHADEELAVSNELRAARRRIGQAAALDAQTRRRLAKTMSPHEREELARELEALAVLREETRTQLRELEARMGGKVSSDSEKQ
jgi:transposase